jgi:hypothetical protein
MIKPQRQLQRHDRHDVKGGVPEGLPEDGVAQQLLVVHQPGKTLEAGQPPFREADAQRHDHGEDDKNQEPQKAGQDEKIALPLLIGSPAEGAARWRL